MHFPLLLCFVVGCMIFFLIGLYYMIRFAVRDGILDAEKRSVRRVRERHDD